MAMISVEEADSILKRHLPIWQKGSVDVDELSDEVLDQEVRADRDAPPFDRVAMDGICVAWQSFEAGARSYRVAGVIAAGELQRTLTDLESCFEIMTGATLPIGASLVIPYEQIEIRAGVANVILDARRNAFENIHRRGADCKADDLVLRAGCTMNGARWGIATAFGYSSLNVRRLPRVKVISTGDEVVDVRRQPLAHQIRGSNGYAIRAALLQAGFTGVAIEHVSDDPVVLRRNYIRDSALFDVLIYSGGISKGKFDFLPQLWLELGVEEHFRSVSQRPGKPMWFGSDLQTKTVVLGLPGNPNPSLICLRRYFLEHQNLSSGGARPLFARLGADYKFEKKMTSFVPVTVSCSVDSVLTAMPLKPQSSGDFTALAASDGFLELPTEPSLFSAGESFRYFPWSRT
ncbi:molybdopterin molybdotransferase MoeA [soil metagenome]